MPTVTTAALNQWTLEDYIEVWINAFLVDRKAQNVASGTIKFYNVKLGLFTQYCGGQEIKQISQITPAVLREFLLYLANHGHNPGGVLACFKAVRAFLIWWEGETDPEGWKNPIHKVKPPKNPQELIDGVTQEQFDRLLRKCGSDYLGIRDRAILYVLYDTGVRAEELCNIKLKDVNFIDKSIIIPMGKGRKPRYVFFGKKTKKQIRAWLKVRGLEDVYLFINRSGDKLVYIALRQIVRRITNAAGLHGIGLHDFRRGFTLNCLNAGMAEITIARLLGHANTQLIGRYAKQKKTDLEMGYKSPIDISEL